MSRSGKKKIYAVAAGRTVGIFPEWYGPGGAEEQIRGFSGARFKAFTVRSDAEEWLSRNREPGAAPTAERPVGAEATGVPAPRPTRRARSARTHGESTPDAGRRTLPHGGQVIIYTDGGAVGNPGPGGYGAVVLCGATRNELSGGYRRTTNNRMELMACLVALESLVEPSRVVVYSDSKYLVNAISKGWIRRWQKENWKRPEDGSARPNTDLWKRLLALLDSHDVEFRWVKGHAGTRENERCDKLAVAASRRTNLPVDEGYLRQRGAAG
jgi:ribonuclease HI